MFICETVCTLRTGRTLQEMLEEQVSVSMLLKHEVNISNNILF